MKVIKLTEEQYRTVLTAPGLFQKSSINETKKYYPNMDVEIKKDGRVAPKMGEDEFKEKLSKVFNKYYPEDKFSYSKFIYKICRYNDHKKNGVKATVQ